MRNRLYINLINFNTIKLAGVGYFFKRIASNICFDDPIWKNVDQVCILANKKVNPIELFDFKCSDKIRILYLPYSQNFLIRILYEQLLIPLYLVGKRGVFFSPTPAIPLLCKIFTSRIYTIATIHDMIPFRIDKKYSFLRGIYVKFISKWAARNATQVITVSEYSKSDIVEIAKIAEQKVEVIYNFVPELTFRRSEVLEPFFITVCTIEPGKNIETMLKGFKTFLLQDVANQKYHYKIIGQYGWGYTKILESVAGLDLTENVEFTGYLTDEHKNEYLEKCIGMIYLSKYEGFGIPPLEAMYFNKISIVSDCSSLPEVVGNAGIIQDPDDHNLLTINLSEMIGKSEVYSKNIPQQLAKFDPYAQIEKFTKCILKFYD